MSNWTQNEVDALCDINGGRNAAVRHIRLAKAPDCGMLYPGGSRPKQGDRIEIFKQFVMDCYEYGKFKADTPCQPISSGLSTPNTSLKTTNTINTTMNTTMNTGMVTNLSVDAVSCFQKEVLPFNNAICAYLCGEEVKKNNPSRGM